MTAESLNSSPPNPGSQPSKASISIIGGGLLGMTLALRFAQAGKAVTLFEAAPELGGLAATWSIGGITWDKHYHVTLLSDVALRGLLEELGLSASMRWVQTKTGFFTGGRLHSMSDVTEFLRFPPLGLLNKLRLGLTILHASRIRDAMPLEATPVDVWLRRLSGRTTFEKIWEPLLRAKLGDRYREASAAFIWAIIARMYAARRTGLKKEMFGYAAGGYATILARFASTLKELGTEIHTSAPIAGVEPAPGGGVVVRTADGTKRRFDDVISTASAPAVIAQCPALSAREKEKLAAVRYQGIICTSLLSKVALSPYYVTNITDPVPFSAVIEMSALVDRAEFSGRHLVYVPKYLAADDPLFEADDATIERRFVGALEAMYPHFKADDVVAFKVSRVRNVMPIPTLNYSRNVLDFRTSVPGFSVVNSSHIVNGTLNVNETIALAERAAATLITSNGVADR